MIVPEGQRLNPKEMHALANRLQARGDSVLMKDQPEQQADLRRASNIVRQAADLEQQHERSRGESPFTSIPIMSSELSNACEQDEGA